MRFGILGPLTICDNGTTIERRPATPTAPKQRQLLALLLLNAGKVVSVSECIEELWGEAPPASATSTLQTYVMQLRRGFRGTRDSTAPPNGRLVTRDRGYSLIVHPGELDAEVFGERVRRAEEAAAKADEFETARQLRLALCLWRGPALVDVQAGPVLSVRVAGLEERRLSVLYKRIEVDLRLGAHHELLGELSMLTGQYPMHENLHAQFMIALYRSGRQADSLQVFNRLRRELGEELGLGPSPRLSRLQQAILNADPILDAPVTSTPVFALDLIPLQRPVHGPGRR
jgi:DNA-binding SARP family transcriptional activator